MDLTTLVERLNGLNEDTDLEDIFNEEEINALVENINQLDELSRATIKSYFNKALDNVAQRASASGRRRKSDDLSGRYEGISRAAKRLPKRGMYKKTAEKLTAEDFDNLSDDELEDNVENIDQLDELSKAKLQAYIDKAVPNMASHAKAIGRNRNDILDAPGHLRKALNRKASLKLAGDKLTRRGKYNKSTNEDVDQLDELSRGLLARYVRKAAANKSNLSREEGSLSHQLANARWLSNDFQKPDEEKINQGKKELVNIYKKTGKRDLGINRALKRLAKEDVDQLDELSRGLLAKYVRKAAANKSDLSRRAGVISHQLGHARWLSNDFQKPDEEKINRGEKGLVKLYSKSFKRDLGIDRALNKLAKEDVDQLSLFETLASDTLVAGAAPGESKTSYIQQLIAATPNMSIDDLSHLLNQALELSANQNGDSAAGVVDKNRASIAIKSAVKEDIDSIFNGQDLSEDFKEKIATLFETAVHARVNEAILDLTKTV
jgi:hypothetical protein